MWAAAAAGGGGGAYAKFALHIVIRTSKGQWQIRSFSVHSPAHGESTEEEEEEANSAGGGEVVCCRARLLTK